MANTKSILIACVSVMFLTVSITCFGLLTMDGKLLYDSTIPLQRDVMSRGLQTPVEGTDVQYRVAIVATSVFWANQLILPRFVTCELRIENSSVRIEKATYESGNTQRADVLIFSGIIGDIDIWQELAKRRQHNQLWVFATEESAFTSRKFIPPIEMSDIHFNISSTYHPKSDIYTPYGAFSPFTGEEKTALKFESNFYQKEHLMAWVSSHCSTPMWRRSDAVHDLGNYIPIDMYGDCGEISCPKQSWVNCTRVFRKYKFIAAFENSCCGGYITEKFWNVVSLFKAIPVVIGAPKVDYERQAPSNSFIHADDFDSLKDLADYILRVSKDKDLYDSYFQWKNNGTVKCNPIRDITSLTDFGVCRLIDFLEAKKKDLSKRVFDPYGPNWLGGCNECGHHKWIKDYSNFLKFLK